MFEWSNRTLLAGALLALIIVVFGFLPAAEAATCAPEAQADAAASSFSASPEQNQEQGKGGDLKHGGCAHGHCHHGSTGIQPLSIAVPAKLDKTGGLKAPKCDQMASRTPAGPDRPPRV